MNAFSETFAPIVGAVGEVFLEQFAQNFSLGCQLVGDAIQNYLMPLLGFLLGSTFAGVISRFSHWVAFILLAAIGANMVRESFGAEEEDLAPDFSPKAMLPLAVATSIDALAVGVSFAAMQVSIGPAVALIGVTTCCLSAVGVKVGNLFGMRYKAMAERAGGIVLILMGAKILLEGIGIL